MVRAGRHHADHFERLRVQHDLAAEHVWRGVVLCAPCAIAEDRNAAVIRQLVIRAEFPAARRPQPEDAEIPCRDAKRRELDRLSFARELDIPMRVPRDSFEAALGRPDVAQVEMVHREFRVSRVAIEDARHAIGRGVGKRLQQHSLDHAENRAIRSDAQRQREDDHRRESWRFRQTS